MASQRRGTTPAARLIVACLFAGHATGSYNGWAGGPAPPPPPPDPRSGGGQYWGGAQPPPPAGGAAPAQPPAQQQQQPPQAGYAPNMQQPPMPPQQPQQQFHQYDPPPQQQQEPSEYDYDGRAGQQLGVTRIRTFAYQRVRVYQVAGACAQTTTTPAARAARRALRPPLCPFSAPRVVRALHAERGSRAPLAHPRRSLRDASFHARAPPLSPRDARAHDIHRERHVVFSHGPSSASRNMTRTPSHRERKIWSGGILAPRGDRSTDRARA